MNSAMSRDPTLYVEDILEAAQDAVSFVGEVHRNEFLEDKKTIAATSRCFEIIGEAVKKLPESWKSLEPEIPWRSIAGLRDMLAHGYFKVDDAVIWDSATSHLPKLVSACQRILDRAETDNGTDAEC
jgi:uncharacterized protein with HEPN domain